MFKSKLKTIIIGYGNPGRQDDGLGQLFISQLREQLSERNRCQLRLQSNYQLTVEDAYDILEFDQVIFVDASMNAQAPFAFTKITETNNSGMGSHSLTPNAVIRLCETLYGTAPKAFVLAIKGYEFEQFDEHLSTKANTNMLAAVEFLITFLNDGLFEGVDGDNHQA